MRYPYGRSQCQCQIALKDILQKVILAGHDFLVSACIVSCIYKSYITDLFFFGRGRSVMHALELCVSQHYSESRHNFLAFTFRLHTTLTTTYFLELNWCQHSALSCQEYHLVHQG